MDKKYIERPKKFDQRTYNDQYQRDHYRSFSARLKPEVYSQIDDYCKDHGISKAEFLKIALESLTK